MQVVENCSANELTAFIKANITVVSQVTTDGWAAYNSLQDTGYPHKVIVQSKTDDKESVLPSVHLVTSLVKRVMLGTFQGRFDPQYLQRYLDEYVFRFNRRACRSIGKRFWRIMQQTAQSDPVFLKNLILEVAT
jgi:hypothetical protein